MKTFEGIVVSTKMQKTAVVRVERERAHPLYKKRMKADKKFKADTGDFSVASGDRVRIGQTRPMSKEKHFKIIGKI